jgi:hypothetical protein
LADNNNFVFLKHLVRIRLPPKRDLVICAGKNVPPPPQISTGFGPSNFITETGCTSCTAVVLVSYDEVLWKRAAATAFGGLLAALSGGAWQSAFREAKVCHANISLNRILCHVSNISSSFGLFNTQMCDRWSNYNSGYNTDRVRGLVDLTLGISLQSSV